MGSEYACVQNGSNDVLCHHNKRLMGYFQFLHGSGIICLLLNIPEKSHWQHLLEKPEEAETHLPFKQTGTTTIFHSDTNPVFGHILIHSFECSGCNTGINFVVILEYTFFQLCSNSGQISFRLTRFRRSHVKRPAVVLTSHTSGASFLLDVSCAPVQNNVIS